MSTKHTPSIVEIIAEGLDQSASDGNGLGQKHFKVCKLANAAPDLLAALTEITEHAAKYGAAPFSATLMFGRAKAAIAKAEGR